MRALSPRHLPGWLRGTGSEAGESADGSRSVVQGGFFGGFWFAISIVLILLGAATGRPGLAIIGLLGVFSAVLAWSWARVALRDVSITVSTDHRFALQDDEIVLSVRIRNQKLIPVPWTTVEVEVARGLETRQTRFLRLTDRHVVRLSSALAPFGNLLWRTPLVARRRGLHRIGPVRVRAGDPFGFFTASMEIAGPPPITVYPVIVPVSPSFSARELLGEARVAHSLLTDPTRIRGVRDYQPGDPFRSISWKATARLGTLQTRVEEPATSRQVQVLLNLDTHEFIWQGVDAIVVETNIAAAASVLVWADRAGYAIGLATNGRISGASGSLVVPSSRGDQQLQRCLDGLARLSALSTVPFPHVLDRLVTNGDRGGVVVIIATIISDNTVRTIAQLQRQGRQVVLVPTGEAMMPDVPGLQELRVDQAAIQQRLHLDRSGLRPTLRADAPPATASEPAGTRA